MKKLIQTIKLRRFKTEVNKEIIEKTYEGNYLVWFKDNSCQECYTKDDLIRLLEKDHIKPIRYIFNMSDRIIVDRDIHINIEEVFQVKENSMAINFNDEETIICFSGVQIHISKENSMELAHRILDYFEWYEEEEDE